ncbi:hypothetical protein SARC_13227, partial [Sphaeroforma arctica JP610]
KSSEGHVTLNHSFSQPIALHRRSFVWRVTCFNHGTLLLQAATQADMQKWVLALNTAAAEMSVAPMSAGVSSYTALFHRPIMPTSVSNLDKTAQLTLWRRTLEQTRLDLDEHKKRKGAPGRPI